MLRDLVHIASIVLIVVGPITVVTTRYTKNTTPKRTIKNITSVIKNITSVIKNITRVAAKGDNKHYLYSVNKQRILNMRITKKRLAEIIQEEVQAYALRESLSPKKRAKLNKLKDKKNLSADEKEEKEKLSHQ